MAILKDLPQELLAVLPVGEDDVKITTTNGTYINVFLQDEVWVFKRPNESAGKRQYTFPVVGEGNIKTLGYPYGLSAWGHVLSRVVTGCDYKLMKLEENKSGKTRVRFTLEEDTIIAHNYNRPVVVKKGVYDYMIPTPVK